MKKVVLLSIVISLLSKSFSQTVSYNYAEKCKKNKNTGWVLFGTGVAVAATGFLITEIDGKGDQSILSENFDVGGWTFFAGLASCAGSIPFFLAAHNSCKKNRRTSAQIKYINTNTLLTAVPNRFPAISIKINLP